MLTNETKNQAIFTFLRKLSDELNRYEKTYRKFYSNPFAKRLAER